jgi:putative nucleotidyltransferase with HDIG domain
VGERCVCARCGAHVVCTVGLATVGGMCGVCGGTELTPLLRGNGAGSNRRFAVASVAEVDMMSDSGYGGIVLDRLAKQTAGVLAVEQSCIFARDHQESDMTIVAAAHGSAEDSVGKRVRVGAEKPPPRQSPRAAVELCWEGEVQGALAIGSDTRARQFTPQELEVLQSLGKAASAALAHAHARPPLTGDIRDTVRRLATSLAELDGGTADHSRHVVEIACDVGRACGLSRAGLAELGVAALLHDIGKVRVPESIITKPGPLTTGEREVMAQHPIFGAEALTRVAGLEVVATLVRYHHERWDGAGYPDGLSGPRIPLASRIIAVCDAYSAMISDRPYRNAMTHHRALAELRTAAGAQFDPELVARFDETLTRKGMA